MRHTIALTGLAALVASIGVLAQDGSHEYAVNGEQATTGSNIARPVATGTRIPFDRRYSQLTSEQQRVVKSDYTDLGAADEPPFPSNGLQPIYRAIANSRPTAPVSGELAILVDVDTSGDATSASVSQSTDAQLAKIATQALLHEKYKPAMCAGRACKMQFRFHVLLSAR